MRPLLLISAVLLSVPAWATGERVRLLPAAEPLRPVLCVSLDCQATGPVEATIGATVKAGKLVPFVRRRAGAVDVGGATLDAEAPAASAVDLVRAGSAVVAVVEGQAPAPAQAEKSGRPAARLAKRLRHAKPRILLVSR